MADSFYVLSKPTVKKVKNIFLWANKNCILTQTDMLNCSVSFRRVLSDKPFEEIITHINKNSVGFFRIIYRSQMNTWGILPPNKTNTEDRRDVVEVFIRSIDIGKTEYFIFVYMEPNNFDYMLKKYSMIKL